MAEPPTPSDELAELLRTGPDRLAGGLDRLTLSEQGALALALPAPQRLEFLLHAPKPLALVRSLPDSELYLTVRELGPSDALPLIALASAGQLQHVLDLESWRSDRYDDQRAGAWVAVLLDAGEPSLRRFLRAADDDSLALLVQRWIRVREIVPEGHGHEIHVLEQTESGHERGLISPDGAYLLCPVIPEHAGAVRRITQLLYREDPARYLQAMWTAVAELPSALEEQAFRWRQSRLEEHGFPPWDEAITVYAPPASRSAAAAASGPADSAPPQGLLRRLGGRGRLVAAVERLPVEARERVLHETLALANHLLVADGADTGDPAAHRRALRTAAGYVGIALETHAVDEGESAVEPLGRIPVLELFREGYARAVELQARARALERRRWVAAHPRALDLLEPALAEEIRGLLLPRPFVARGGSPRPFRSLDEITRSGEALETAELLGRLMVERLGLDLGRVLDDCEAVGTAPPRFSAFLLTLLAWHSVRSELRGDPLPPEVVADFLRNVASRRTASPDAARRALDALADRVVRAFELSARETELLRAFGAGCLERLADECGGLDPGVPVDPRFVTCLLLNTEGS